MSRSSELLHAWMSKRNHRSQSDAAKDLGVRPSAVNNWLQGVSHPKPAIAARMARDVGWDELKTLADLEAERCKGEDARVWKRLASAAVLCLVIVLPYSAKAERVAHYTLCEVLELQRERDFMAVLPPAQH